MSSLSTLGTYIHIYIYAPCRSMFVVPHQSLLVIAVGVLEHWASWFVQLTCWVLKHPYIPQPLHVALLQQIPILCPAPSMSCSSSPFLIRVSWFSNTWRGPCWPGRPLSWYDSRICGFTHTEVGHQHQGPCLRVHTRYITPPCPVFEPRTPAPKSAVLPTVLSRC